MSDVERVDPSTGTRSRRVRPYPFDQLERLARSQVEAGRAWIANLPFGDGARWTSLAEAMGGEVRAVLVESYAFPARELATRLPGDGACTLLRLSATGQRRAVLAIEPSLALAVVRRALGAASEARSRPLLDEAEAAKLVELVGRAVADMGARVEGYAADVSALGPLDALFPDPMVLALDGRLTTPAGAGWVRLLSPERLRTRPPLLRARSLLDARRQRLAGIPVALRVEVGRTRVTRAEFAALTVGDVVLFEQFGPRPPFGGPLLLRLGRGAIAAHLDGEGLTVTKAYSLGGSTMAAQDPTSPAPHEASEGDDFSTEALLRALPVELVCELGRVTLDGRELLELRPGAVIPIGRPLAGPVDLTVGNRVVARGELVDVEGEMGVRVTWIDK